MNMLIIFELDIKNKIKHKEHDKDVLFNPMYKNVINLKVSILH